MFATIDIDSYNVEMEKKKLKKVVGSGKVALLVIDMQGDYCEFGYYMDKAGYDIDRLRAPIPSINNILNVARNFDIPVIYTRQYRAIENTNISEDKNTFPTTSLKGEPGWEIIAELKPHKDDTILDKTTCSVFASTKIDKFLKENSINTLIFCGNTIDVCVHSSLRSANDLGYNCITISDCCGAINDRLYKWSLESIKVEDGVFGDVISSEDLIAALKISG